jgi:fumarate hydratase subunit beta
MAEVHLKLPASESDVRKLRAGDTVFLSGTLFTARDEAHRRALELKHAGKSLPVKFLDGALYHCGPIMKKEGAGWALVAAGPTTSSRMNSMEPGFIEEIGVRLIIGKGGMNRAVGETLQRFGAAYLSFTGGAAVLAARRVKEVKGVEWLDLGMPEAIWILEAEEFGPLTVSMDAHGTSLYEEVARRIEVNTAKVRSRLGLERNGERGDAERLSRGK